MEGVEPEEGVEEPTTGEDEATKKMKAKEVVTAAVAEVVVAEPEQTNMGPIRGGGGPINM